MIRTNVLNCYFRCSNTFGTPTTNPILTMVIPMLHPKIFQSKLEFSKWILAATVQMKKTNEGDMANDRNVKCSCGYSDGIFIFMFLHSSLEFGVLNIKFIAEFTD